MPAWSELLLQGRGGAAAAGLWNIVGLVVLLVDALVIVAVWKSHKTTMVKVVWTILVLVLGPLGWILYFFLGRERS